MADNEVSQSDIDAMFPGGEQEPQPSGSTTNPDQVSQDQTVSGPEDDLEPEGGVATETMEEPGPKPTAQPVKFGQLQKKETKPNESSIEFLLDVPVNIAVELGRTSMFIKNVLSLGVGSVVELNKLAGEPVDLLINGKLVARGEVVVINENFGVKIIDIISPEQRIKNLN